MNARFPFGMMKVCWNKKRIAVIQRCKYTKRHSIVQFKIINFILCELYQGKKEVSSSKALKPVVCESYGHVP